jgi:hypothetical protein
VKKHYTGMLSSGALLRIIIYIAQPLLAPLSYEDFSKQPLGKNLPTDANRKRNIE